MTSTSRSEERSAAPGGSASSTRRPTSGVRLLLSNPSARIGLMILLLSIALAAVHPLLMETIWATDQIAYRPLAGHDATIATHPSPPSLRHLLGTDPLGRDVLSMLMVAIRPTLLAAVVAATLIGVTALLTSTAAATFPGPVDTAVSLVADSLLLLPAPVVIIVAMIVFPPDAFGHLEAGVLYGLLAGLSTATLVLRSRALTVIARPFVEAARVAGAGPWRVIRKELIPHLVPLAVVQMMVGVVGVIVATAFAQYLTNPDDTLGLGTMLYSSLRFQGFLLTGVAWNVLLAAGLAITGLCAAFYLFGRGIQQLLDPYAKGTSTSTLASRN